VNGAEKAVIVVGTDGRTLRRGVGPNAWVVLEELVGVAVMDAVGRWVAATTIAGLANELGLGRDAVDGGLRRLRRAGVVTFEAPRRPDRGRFGPGRYVIAAEVAASLRGPATEASRPAVPSTCRVRAESTHEQLALGLEGGELGAGRIGIGGSGVSIGDVDSVDVQMAQPVGGGRSVVERSSTGQAGWGLHELALKMRAAPGDIRGDMATGGRRC